MANGTDSLQQADKRCVCKVFKERERSFLGVEGASKVDKHGFVEVRKKIRNLELELDRLDQERERVRDELTSLRAIAGDLVDERQHTVLPRASSATESNPQEPSNDGEEIQTLNDAVEESPGMEQDLVPSTEKDSSSSDSEGSEEWNAESPYGSRPRMLKGIEALKSGHHFADDYVIDTGSIAGKPHLRFARRRYGKHERVILRFYWEEDRFKNTGNIHSELSLSEHVCRIIQTLKTPKTGFPPCVVFENGKQTLCDWLRTERSPVDKNWCLHQILVGIKDMHSKGIVHCDVKPSNVMFFSDNVCWKLIDLEAACKEGKSRPICYTALYAAPEVLQELQDFGHLPIARPSSDIWSFGVVVYEVLTGQRFFGGDMTPEEILQLILSRKAVEERIALIPNDKHREIVSNFLKINPLERWSAVEALQHAVFHPDASTTTSCL